MNGHRYLFLKLVNYSPRNKPSLSVCLEVIDFKSESRVGAEL